MAKKIKTKRVSYMVGNSLDGPVFCEHDVVEDTTRENRKYPTHKKTALKHGQSPLPRPNLRQMPSSHKEGQNAEDLSSRSNRRR